MTDQDPKTETDKNSLEKTLDAKLLTEGRNALEKEIVTRLSNYVDEIANILEKSGFASADQICKRFVVVSKNQMEQLEGRGGKKEASVALFSILHNTVFIQKDVLKTIVIAETKAEAMVKRLRLLDILLEEMIHSATINANLDSKEKTLSIEGFYTGSNKYKVKDEFFPNIKELKHNKNTEIFIAPYIKPVTLVTGWSLVSGML